MNPLLISALTSFVRWLVTLGAGYLIARGVWTNEQAAEIAAFVALAVVTLVLSLYQKYRARLQFLAALEAPPGTPEQQIGK